MCDSCALFYTMSPHIESAVRYVQAATTLGAFKTGIREYPFPEIPPDADILKMEPPGVCGSDWQANRSDRSARSMVICSPAQHGSRNCRPHP
jgi:hypothetical protein